MAQLVNAFDSQAEGWVFESATRLGRKKYVVTAPLPNVRQQV